MKKILLVALGVCAALVVLGVAVALVVRAVAPGQSAVPVVSGGPSVASHSVSPTLPPTAATAAPTRSADPPAGGAGSGPLDSGDRVEPAFTSGSATMSVDCPVPGEGPAGGSGGSPTVELTWGSEGAETAFVGVDTTDARAEPFSQVEPTGTVSIPFACPAVAHTYTITLVGPGGQKSKAFTVQNTGYRG